MNISKEDFNLLKTLDFKLTDKYLERKALQEEIDKLEKESIRLTNYMVAKYISKE